MAKSLRSRFKRKMRAIKRVGLETKEGKFTAEAVAREIEARATADVSMEENKEAAPAASTEKVNEDRTEMNLAIINFFH